MYGENVLCCQISSMFNAHITQFKNIQRKLHTKLVFSWCVFALEKIIQYDRRNENQNTNQQIQRDFILRWMTVKWIYVYFMLLLCFCFMECTNEVFSVCGYFVLGWLVSSASAQNNIQNASMNERDLSTDATIF